MGLFGGVKILSPGDAVKIISFLARRIPDERVDPEFSHTIAGLRGRARSDFLRRLYLDLESRFLTVGDGQFPDHTMLRARITQEVKLDRFYPDGFSLLFQSRASQLYGLLQQLLENLWERSGWTEELILTVLHEAAANTPLGAMRHVSEGDWRRACGAYAKRPPRERENIVLRDFQRVIERTFRDLVKERGEARARVLVEEVVRHLQQEFATVDALSGILVVLPPEILPDERIALAPREELAEAVTRQMREMRGKNIALVYEARQLQAAVRDLQEAKSRLEAMASAQQDFITVVSHQFRTPLAAIRWQAEALADMVAERSELADIADPAKTVHERAVFLIGVLENIFDLLEIDSGRFTLYRKERPFSATFSAVCEEYTKEAARQSIQLDCSAEENMPDVSHDADALKRVLSILIRNAIQYSSEDGTIEVKAWRALDPIVGAELAVSVQDSGIGIRPEDRPKIFEKFFRGHNAQRKIPDGEGIALYIAKRIVEFHGGKLWVDSRGEGLGSTFYFTIPEQGATQESSST